jgi:hypothetical protein
MAKKRPKERGSIPGAFAWRLIEMLESPANRVMSLSAKRILERLEIELFHHGGKPEQNGLLPCTFDHFEEFGIHRHAIAPAIREAVALGFVQITRPGCAGNAGYRQPTLYRLTYRHFGSHRETTDEWKRIKTIEEAEAIAERARGKQSERRPKNKSPVPETALTPVPETTTGNDHFPMAETTTTGPVAETTTTSISRVGPVSVKEGQRPDPRDTALAPAAAAAAPSTIHALVTRRKARVHP